VENEFLTWTLAYAGPKNTEQIGGRQTIQDPYFGQELLVVRYRSLGLRRAPIPGPHPHAQCSFGPTFQYVAGVHALRSSLQYLHLDLGRPFLSLITRKRRLVCSIACYCQTSTKVRSSGSTSSPSNLRQILVVNPDEILAN